MRNSNQTKPGSGAWGGLQLVLILALGLVAACQQQDKPLDSGLAGYDPHLIENQQKVCADRGGRFGQGLSGAFVCYETTKDANKNCSKSTDCQGYCLARSSSCTPVVPLLGCHEVLNSTGARSTLCLE